MNYERRANSRGRRGSLYVVWCGLNCERWRKGTLYAWLSVRRTRKRAGYTSGLLLQGTGVITLECLIKAPDKATFVDGLAQEAERSGLQHTLPDFFLGKRSHENDRGAVAICNQPTLHLDSAHAGHLYVSNQA